MQECLGSATVFGNEPGVLLKRFVINLWHYRHLFVFVVVYGCLWFPGAQVGSLVFFPCGFVGWSFLWFSNEIKGSSLWVGLCSWLYKCSLCLVAMCFLMHEVLILAFANNVGSNFIMFLLGAPCCEISVSSILLSSSKCRYIFCHVVYSGARWI